MKKLTLLLGLFLMSCASLLAQAPANCGDIMLQGFYWDSYQGGSYGNTKWKTLEGQATEIAETFSMIWLPPSATQEFGGGVGYHPRQYSDQNSSWGSDEELESLLSTLKSKGCKPIADIVINHKSGCSSATNLCTEDFGKHGTFKGDWSMVCKNDENPGNGGYDTGENWDGARDLDHTNSKTRDMIKAYLKWLKDLGYKGWRYDFVKGFSGNYVGEYNSAAGASFSVGEYWDGDYGKLVNWINATGKKSTAFDFCMKYDGLNKGLAANNYSALAGYGGGSGLIGDPTYKQYAVTFVDNHDTFRDGSKYTGDVVKANAYILAMPGVPCVFWPHWYQHKSSIKAMAAARKAMGITNTSDADCSGTTGSYFCGKVTGSKGTLICYIGNGWSDPAGYNRACGGNGWAYYTSTQVTIPDNGDNGDNGNNGGDIVSSQSYAIRVNGTTDYPATYTGKAQYSEHEEYKVSVQLNAGDTFVTYDLVNNAGWVMAIETGGKSSNFTAGTSSVTCNEAGCYDFYIKMLYQQDIMYIDAGTNCQGGTPAPNPNPDPNPGPTPDPTPDPTPGGTGYSLFVNGTDKYNMTDEGAWDMDPSYNQFSLPNVSLKAGDTFVFYNNETGDTWGSVTVDPESISSITGSGTDFSVSADGCYSVYLKLKFKADNVYFGEGSDCSSVTPDPTPDPKPTPDPDPDPVPGPVPTGDYYLIGYINGADYGIADDFETIGDYKFVNGKLTATFEEPSYVCIKTGDNLNWYNTATFVKPTETGASAIYETASETINEKMGVPAGTVYFTLSDNGDGTLTLSYKTDASAIIEAETVNMTIFPNPTSDYITISCDETIDEVVINAINGSEVIRTNSNEVDLSSLNPSMYFVNVMLQNGDIVRSKVIRK